MKNKALYYPYINLPKKDWTYKTLLYWDSILSIVPSSYIYHPEKLESFMLDLVREGLVEQIFPVEHLYSVENYAETFLNFVETKYIKSKKPVGNEFSLLHMEKLDSIARELIKMNLAVKKDDAWILVEKNVANDFMIYLANILSKKHDAVPVSDKMSSAQLYDNHKSFYINKKYTKIQNTVLDNVLPYPSGNLTIRELVDFKEKHSKLLPKFRDLIEKRSYELSSIKEKEYRNRRLQEVIAEINEGSLEIQEAMKSKFKNICYGSILPIFGASTAILEATSPVGILGGVATIAGTLQSAFEKINDNKYQQPLAYIAHARRNLL
jgi:hypothetical protein